MYEGQDSQNNLSIHSVCCLIAFYECDDAISRICKKYFGRSAKCVNLPIWAYEVWDSISSSGEQWPGREESPRCTHFLTHSTPRRLLSPPVRVPVETCVENLLHGDACLLPVCRGGWAMSRLWVGLALQSTQKGINPDILPKDFPLPNKIWQLANFVKNVPQVDSEPRCIALPPNADRSHWRPRPMLAELLSQPGKLDESITNTSYNRKLRWINITKTRYAVCIKVSTYYQCETFQMFF